MNAVGRCTTSAASLRRRLREESRSRLPAGQVALLLLGDPNSAITLDPSPQSDADQHGERRIEPRDLAEHAAYPVDDSPIARLGRDGESEKAVAGQGANRLFGIVSCSSNAAESIGEGEEQGIVHRACENATNEGGH